MATHDAGLKSNTLDQDVQTFPQKAVWLQAFVPTQQQHRVGAELPATLVRCFYFEGTTAASVPCVCELDASDAQQRAVEQSCSGAGKLREQSLSEA